MPTLHYKYRMNEPFVGGETSTYQVSHEQDSFKKKFVYGLKPDVKDFQAGDDVLKSLKEDEEKLKREFEGPNQSDLSTFIVNRDTDQLFGLKIDKKLDADFNGLFEFDIEEYISLV